MCVLYAGTVEVHELGVVVKANIVIPYFNPNDNSNFSDERTAPISYESLLLTIILQLFCSRRAL